MGVKLTVKCSEGELAVWKDAAHEARLSLSEWVRRVLSGASGNGGLSAGDPERERQTLALPSQESGGHPASAAASPAPAEKPFHPDFKKGK